MSPGSGVRLDILVEGTPIEHISIIKHFIKVKHSITGFRIAERHVVCEAISRDIAVIENQRLLLRHRMLRHCRDASVILEKRRRRPWGAGHLAGRACGGANAGGIDPVENSTEYSGGVEGVDGGGAAGGPDGIGGAEGGYALGPVFGAENWTKNK